MLTIDLDDHRKLPSQLLSSLLFSQTGVVSAVDSGDKIVMSGPPRPNGPPLKKEITLASLQAPRLVREKMF